MNVQMQVFIHDRMKLSPTGCWVWRLSVQYKGYGQVKIRGRVRAAHRVAWEAFRGPIPDGMQVLHDCDTPPCVNPDHMFLGTNKDNMADKIAKGRGWSKLTRKDVQVIRRSRASQKELALRFNVHQSTISMVKNRKTWV